MKRPAGPTYPQSCALSHTVAFELRLLALQALVQRDELAQLHELRLLTALLRLGRELGRRSFDALVVVRRLVQRRLRARYPSLGLASSTKRGTSREQCNSHSSCQLTRTRQSCACAQTQDTPTRAITHTKTLTASSSSSATARAESSSVIFRRRALTRRRWACALPSFVVCGVGAVRDESREGQMSHMEPRRHRGTHSFSKEPPTKSPTVSAHSERQVTDTNTGPTD
jgi:hypothetical protein